MKLDILAIGVHPDDIELGCSGTLLKHIDLGYTVGLCDLTQGELGTRGSAALRLEESEQAKMLMGAVCRENLGMRDGYFAHDEENINKLIHIIRKYKPDIVLANTIADRHPDHGRAAKLIADACFYSGLSKIDTGQEARRPKSVYHYIQDQTLAIDFAVDITAQHDRKIALINIYSSQFYNPQSTEPETPISSQTFINSVSAKDQVYGRAIGAPYAEGFVSLTPLAIDNLFDIG